MSFDVFSKRLYTKYDNDDIRSRLSARLYGERQKSEPVDSFISRKASLFKRIAGYIPEVDQCRVIKQLLDPRIRLGMRGGRTDTLEELIHEAVEVETDLRQIQRDEFQARPSRGEPPRRSLPATDGYRRQAPERGFRPNVPALENRRNVPAIEGPRRNLALQAPGSRQPSAVAPPYPCRHCGGDHYNNQCPRQAPGRDRTERQQPQRQPQRQQPQRQVQWRQPDRQQERWQQTPRQLALPAPPARAAAPLNSQTSGNAGEQERSTSSGRRSPSLTANNSYAAPVPTNDGLPRIPVRWAGEIEWALIDTGASHSLMRADLVQVPDEVPTIGIRMADGLLTSARGPVEVRMDIADVPTHLPCYVLPELYESIIIGQDWMVRNEATLDIKNQCMYFGTTTRQATYWPSRQRRRPKPQIVQLDDGQAPADFVPMYQEILNDFADIFEEDLRQPTTKLVTHSITLTNPEPFRIRRYKYAPRKKEIIKTEVQQMLAAGVIRRSHSQFCSPIVIVDKKDGTPRFCVDYRQLNAQTESEVAQLPLIQDTIRELGEATVFSSIDLKSGYWQVPVAEESRHLTAFSTPEGGTYEFNVMPFGLKNAAGTFQKLMVEVLADYIDEFAKVYLDDVIIYSRNHEEHATHLKRVFERLRMHGLRCSLKKCRFGVDSLDYLGYRVSARNTEPLERHIVKAQEFQTPRNIKGVQSFLGLANWLRDYVPNFATLAAPLTDLTQKGKFKWTEVHDNAFLALKEALSKPLKLSRPTEGIPLVLQTDASTEGMGAVLYQITPGGDKLIISCLSSKFNKTQRKYHCNEQEVLAVVWACQKYRHWLEGQKFTLFTDSKALSWLNKCQDDRAKLHRWAMLLQQYDFDVVHCSGRENQLADFLSRHPVAEARLDDALDDELHLPHPTQPGLDTELERTTADPPRLNSSRAPARTPPVERHRALVPLYMPQPEFGKRKPHRRRGCRGKGGLVKALNALYGPQTITVTQVNPDLNLYEEVCEAQRQSPEYRATRAHWARLQSGEEPALQYHQRILRDEYVVENDLIWHVQDGRRALVVPLAYWRRVVDKYHDSPEAGHPGRDETIRAIARLYYWPAMTRQVRTHVRDCLICASSKRGGALQPAAPQRPHPPARPWQVVSIDAMGPYPLTRRQNRYLLVATDLYSRWVEIKAVKDIKTRQTLDFLEEVCARWGYPQRVITDNGASFRTNMWNRFLDRNGIEGYYSPIYHQRSNPVERRNQEIKKLLRIGLRDQPQDRWDEGIRQIQFTLRNRANAATGVSPSEALLGAQLPAPGEWEHPEVQRPVRNARADREARVQRIRERQHVYARRLYPGGDPPAMFELGDQVLVRTHPGVRPIFGAPWAGPYPIMRVLGDGVYEVDRNGSQYPVHVDDIRPAPRQRQQPGAGGQRPAADPPGDEFVRRYRPEEPENEAEYEHQEYDGPEGGHEEAADIEDNVVNSGDRVPEQPQDSSSASALQDDPQPPATYSVGVDFSRIQQKVMDRLLNAVHQEQVNHRYSNELMREMSTPQTHKHHVQSHKHQVRTHTKHVTTPTVEDCGAEEVVPSKYKDAIPIKGLYP